MQKIVSVQQEWLQAAIVNWKLLDDEASHLTKWQLQYSARTPASFWRFGVYFGGLLQRMFVSACANAGKTRNHYLLNVRFCNN